MCLLYSRFQCANSLRLLAKIMRHTNLHWLFITGTPLHTCPVLSCCSTAVKRSCLPQRGNKSHSQHGLMMRFRYQLYGTHRCTTNPPLLWNHLLHCRHWIAPCCSLIGFLLSSTHLRLALSLSLLKFLEHSSHATSLTTATGALTV